MSKTSTRSRNKKHDTLAFRLADILLKLNSGASFSRQALADEFMVSERTIYRDLNRLAGIVECLDDGRYRLVPTYRCNLQVKDLENLARITGADLLFPSSGRRFLLDLLDAFNQRSYLIKNHHVETVRPDSEDFTTLTVAIQQHNLCEICFGDTLRKVAPYRLVNHKGIWYLAATQNGQLKAYTVNKIQQLRMLAEPFIPDPTVHREIEEEDDIWYSREKTTVIVSVAPQSAYYFDRRNILPRQHLIRRLDDGGLLLGCSISHANQILPLIRYWLPAMRIEQPDWLRESLNRQLHQYLNQSLANP